MTVSTVSAPVIEGAAGRASLTIRTFLADWLQATALGIACRAVAGAIRARKGTLDPVQPAHFFRE